MDESCMLANYEYVSVKNSFAIDVLRKVKAEIEFITKENGMSRVHIDDIRKIIDKHIKEINNETNN